MYCKKCGNPMAEGVFVCPVCGYYEEPVQPAESTNTETLNASVYEQPYAQQVYDQQQYAQQPYDQQQYAQQPYDQQYAQQPYDQQQYAQQPYDQQYAQAYYPEGFANPSFETYEQPRKNTKKIIISAVSCVLALVIVLTAALNLEALKGFVIKTFSSDAKYYSYVEKKAFAEAKNTAVNAYGEVTALFNDESKSIENDISFTVGEDVAELLSSDMADDIINEINKANISLDISQKDMLSQIQIALEMAENPIVNLDVILNMSEGKTYLGAPSLINDYIAAEISDLEEAEMIYDGELWNALPSQKVTEQLLDKYIDVALSGIDDVTSSRAELTVNDITQKCTALEYGISEEDALRISEKVLEAVNSDSEIEKIIKNFNEYAINNDICDSDLDMYEEFKDGLEDLLEEVADEKADADSEEIITVTTYVNSKHEVIGREISYNSEAKFSYKKAQKGKDFASEINVADMIMVSGYGTESNNAIDGQYEVTYGGTDMLTATLTNFDSSELPEGILSGKVKIEADKNLWSLLGVNSMASSAISLYDPSIELVFDIGEKSAETQINILGKDEIMLGISFKSTETKSADIKIPSDAVDTSNQEEFSEWMGNIDINEIKEKLKGNLEKAGVSDDITNSIVTLIEGVISGNNNNDVFEDEITFNDEYSDDWY